MKVTIVKLLGCSPALGKWYYVLEAENGLIDREEASSYIREGTVLDMPDDAWQIDSKEFSLRCDDCGHEYKQKSRLGGKVQCPVCGTEEQI